MIRRILFTTAAAATLLAAAPALAAEQAHDSGQACSCCSDGSMHHVDHALREQAAKKDESPRAAQRPAASDDPFVRNQSYGG